MGLLDHFGGDDVARLGAGLQRHALEAQSLEDVEIGGIAGRGHGHPGARVEQGQKRQNEARRRARGHHDPRGVNRDPMGLLIMGRNSRPQGWAAKRFGVSDAAEIQSRPRCLQNKARRGGAGFAQLQMHDVASRPLQRTRRAQHIQGEKGGHGAAAGGLEFSSGFRHFSPSRADHQVASRTCAKLTP